jgi:hypothetical protein
MNIPNLASKPLLNVRPVWILTHAALFLAVVFLVVNIFVYVRNSQLRKEQIEESERLSVEFSELENAVMANVAELRKVPWRGLTSRVDAMNVIIEQHAFSWLILLRDIEEVLPYDIRLVRIGPSFDKDGILLDLSGIARTDKALLDLLDNMVGDERFSEAIPSREEWPEKSQTTEYEFSLRVRYVPERSGP